jgi:hypothetical protein
LIVALPENQIGFSDQIALTPDDVTDDVLDRLHSRVDEDAVLNWALAKSVVRRSVRLPPRFVDWSDDADLFQEIMR